MNNKGFTLVEVLVVVVLLGLVVGIAIPGVTKAGKRAKEKTLVAKINTIESAAILYGQQNQNSTLFTVLYDDITNSCDVCEGKQNCKCMNRVVTVQDLIDAGLLKPDDEDDLSGKIENPANKGKSLNNCTLTVYKKYGKIYAIYDVKTRGNDCWASR